jgi:hypothetical protein
VWFCSALVLGSLCTLLEHWEWIPRVIPFPNAITTGVSLLSLCGVLLSSTIIVPVLFFAGFALGIYMGWSGPLMGGLGFALGVAFAVWFDRHTAKKNDTVYTITGYAPGQGHA